MATAGDWVRLTVTRCMETGVSTEVVLKSLEKHIGQSEQIVARVQAVIDHLDTELVNRNDGPVMRQIWLLVTDYLERVLEARAAA